MHENLFLNHLVQEHQIRNKVINKEKNIPNPGPKHQAQETKHLLPVAILMYSQTSSW